MKFQMLIAALLFISVECASQQTDQLSQQEREQIKSEARVVVEDIFAKWVALDVEGVLQHYSTDMVTLRGRSIIGYPEYVKVWMRTKDATSVKCTAFRCEYLVLSADFVVSACTGKVGVSMKSGEKIANDPQTYTDVLKKIGGQWKVIYEHTAGTSIINKVDKN